MMNKLLAVCLTKIISVMTVWLICLLLILFIIYFYFLPQLTYGFIMLFSYHNKE